MAPCKQMSVARNTLSSAFSVLASFASCRGQVYTTRQRQSADHSMVLPYRELPGLPNFVKLKLAGYLELQVPRLNYLAAEKAYYALRSIPADASCLT